MFGAVDEDGKMAFSIIDDRTGLTLGEQIRACIKAGSLIRRYGSDCLCLLTVYFSYSYFVVNMQ